MDGTYTPRLFDEPALAAMNDATHGIGTPGLGTIDRTSEVPYYLQLAHLLERAMDAGSYGPGDRLPGETEMCTDYGLARSTVRETLRHLVDQGRIKLVPRRGAFVTEQADPGWRLQGTQGFFEVEVDQHHSVETRVIEATRCVLPDAAADALELPSGAAGFRLARVRSLDGKLALYSVNYLLPEVEAVLRASEVLSGVGSLNRTLQAAGYETVRARRAVEAVAADVGLSALLGVAVGQPLLLVTSVSWGRDNRPLDFYTSWLRNDVVKVTVEAQAA
jgi:GntR family transcriptional regulator